MDPLVNATKSEHCALFRIEDPDITEPAVKPPRSFKLIVYTRLAFFVQPALLIVWWLRFKDAWGGVLRATLLASFLLPPAEVPLKP
jgi:hypothetical protein